MIDTKNGAKYLDKDPPMEEHGGNITRKILDYLAYLKENLNFVFGTYGKRLTDSAGNINELFRTADETTSRISDAEGNISVLTQRADGFDTTISDMQGNMSQISQKADRIDLLVENVGGENRIKSAAIMLAINGDTSTIKLAADKIDLEGYVTMTDLSTGGRTEINGANITTGFISADRIKANSIGVGKLTGTIENGNWKIDLDAGTLTIGNISADNITTGTLNADRIQANSINVGKLNGSVTNGAWGVTFGSSPSFSVGYLSADKINSGYLSSARIEAGSITAEKININDLFSRNITASNFHITGGTINVTTASSSDNVIVLKNGSGTLSLSPGRGFKLTRLNGDPWISMSALDALISVRNTANNDDVIKIDENYVRSVKTIYGNLANTGYITDGTASVTSIPSSATTTVATVSLAAGRYVVKGCVRSTESMTGLKIRVGTNAGSVQGDSSIGGGTDNALTTVEVLNLTATTTVYLTAYHSSGSSKTVSCSLRAIRIA